MDVLLQYIAILQQSQVYIDEPNKTDIPNYFVKYFYRASKLQCLLKAFKNHKLDKILNKYKKIDKLNE